MLIALVVLAIILQSVALFLERRARLALAARVTYINDSRLTDTEWLGRRLDGVFDRGRDNSNRLDTHGRTLDNIGVKVNKASDSNVSCAIWHLSDQGWSEALTYQAISSERHLANIGNSIAELDRNFKECRESILRNKSRIDDVYAELKPSAVIRTLPLRVPARKKAAK